MHNQIMGSAGMDQDGQLVHDSTYGGENWIDMGAYHQHATMADYGNAFGYPSVPSEPLQRMPPPPVTHTPLPMMMVPTHAHAAWPSMLTSAHGYPTPPHPPPHPPPPAAMRSAAAPAKTAKLPAITTTQPRKTLTDDDRRRMCEYAEAHPQAKQTDIGSIFGVERSTVSKVLRNREKYMSPEDRANSTNSPMKRPKTKAGADVEKALSSYARKVQGGAANGSGSVWLEKLMQKNGLGAPGKLPRRASETSIPDTGRTSPSRTSSSSQPPAPGAMSPSSPAATLQSPSPLSAFSPDAEMGGFVTTDPRQQQLQQQQQQADEQQHVQRPRSQTFPALDLEYADQTLSSPQQQQQRLLHRSASSGSLAGRSASGTTAGAASPVSPSQEDARKAADTLLSFIQSAGLMVDHNEYMAVVRLTEKLRIHQAQQQQQLPGSRPGGLSRIPEGDSEMTNARRPS